MECQGGVDPVAHRVKTPDDLDAVVIHADASLFIHVRFDIAGEGRDKFDPLPFVEID